MENLYKYSPAFDLSLKISSLGVSYLQKSPNSMPVVS